MFHKRTLKIFYLDLRCLLLGLLLWRHFWGIVCNPTLDTKCDFGMIFFKISILTIGIITFLILIPILAILSAFAKKYDQFLNDCITIFALKIKDRSSPIWCKIWHAEKQPNSKLRTWFWRHFKHWQTFSQNVFETVTNQLHVFLIPMPEKSFKFQSLGKNCNSYKMALVW